MSGFEPSEKRKHKLRRYEVWQYQAKKKQTICCLYCIFLLWLASYVNSKCRRCSVKGKADGAARLKLHREQNTQKTTKSRNRKKQTAEQEALIINWSICGAGRNDCRVTGWLTDSVQGAEELELMKTWMMTHRWNKKKISEENIDVKQHKI